MEAGFTDDGMMHSSSDLMLLLLRANDKLIET